MRRRRYRVAKWLGPMAVGALAVLPAPAAEADISPVSLFVPISQPTNTYVATTCLYDLHGIPNGKRVTKLTTCGKLTFNHTFRKRHVPCEDFPTWGTPPDTETATPPILTGRGGDVFLTFRPTYTAGVEVGPWEVTATISVAFITSTGEIAGRVTQVVPAGGARLFAATVTGRPLERMLVTTSNAGFALANIRVGS